MAWFQIQFNSNHQAWGIGFRGKIIPRLNCSVLSVYLVHCQATVVINDLT